MERVSTAERLNEIMKKRGLRQVDILKLSQPLCEKYKIKMNKSDISQYVSGKVEPSQEKLVILGMVLNVSESWLMGFDVSPERKDNKIVEEKYINMFNKFSLLDKREKKIISDLIDVMLSNNDRGG